MHQESPVAEEIIKEYERLSGGRTNWDSHWEEISQRVLPMHSRSFTGKFGQTQGDKRNEFVFDSTASIALNRFMAIMDSLLTPRNQTWQRMSVSNPYLAKDRQVKLYFEEANRVLFKYRYAPKANFASQNQQVYKSVGAYGTGTLFADELGTEPGIRYRNIHLGEIFPSENHQGIIDRALRHFPLTARQALAKWGDKCPEVIKSVLATNPDQIFYFIHCVKPRENYIPGRVDAKGMPFSSHYVSVTGKALLSEGGFNTFPFAFARYEQAPGEVYGRSPIMEVLPAIKTLNEMKKTILKQGHRTVDPILLVHDDGIADSFSFKPGAMNSGAVDSQGRALVHTLPTGNIAIGKDLMDDERAVINDACLVTLFQILVENPQQTATEVMERAREKGILLAPTMGRQQDEYLGPMNEREMDLLSRQGLLPPMPEILIEAGGEYKIVHDSPLSKAQRADEAAGLLRTVESTLNIVNVTQDPAPLDHFDWDVIVPEISDIHGVPSRWMKDPRVVKAMREQRAQAAQEQAMVQAAPGAAAMVSSAAKMKQAGG